jgi:MFS family permease
MDCILMVQGGTLKVFAITAFLFAFLFAGAAVNEDIYELSKHVRMFLFLSSIIFSLIIFIKKKSVSRRATFIFLSILMLSVFYSPRDQYQAEFVKAIFFSFSAIFLSYITATTEFSKKLRIYDLTIILVSIYLFYLIATSTLILDGYMPVILFSDISVLRDIPNYSQGVTKVFSVGLIAIVFKMVYEKTSLHYNFILAIFGSAFFILSLAGGSRGEVLLCIFVLTLMFVQNWRYLFAACFLLVLLFIMISQFVENFDVFTNFPSVARLLYTYDTVSLGPREDLIRESIRLLEDNPQCLILGCGFMFFQNYYGYGYGASPHNWIIEFIISFGIVLLAGLIISVWLYIARNYKHFSINEKFLFILSIYFWGVALKGGYLPGEPLLYGSFFFVLFSVRKTHQVFSDPSLDCMSRSTR